MLVPGVLALLSAQVPSVQTEWQVTPAYTAIVSSEGLKGPTALAANSTSYFSVWADDRFGATGLVGGRVGIASVTALDDPGLFVSEGLVSGAPSVTSLLDGSFVVAFTTIDGRVSTRVLNASGAWVSISGSVAPRVLDVGACPSVVSDQHGGFAVIYTKGPALLMQRFSSPSVAFDTTPLLVVTGVASGTCPTAAFDASFDGFLVAYQVAGGSRSVFVGRMSSTVSAETAFSRFEWMGAVAFGGGTGVVTHSTSTGLAVRHYTGSLFTNTVSVFPPDGGSWAPAVGALPNTNALIATTENGGVRVTEVPLFGMAQIRAVLGGVIYPSLASSGSGFAFAFTGGSSSMTWIVDSSRGLLPMTVMTAAYASQQQPTLAAVGPTIAAAWYEDDPAGAIKVLTVRQGVASAVATVADGINPSLAAGHGEFLLTYECASAPSNLCLRRGDANANFGSEIAILGTPATWPRAIATSAGFLVVSRLPDVLTVARVDASGAPLNTFLIATGVLSHHTVAGAPDGGVQVAYATGQNVNAIDLEADGGLVLGPVTLSTLNQPTTTLSSTWVGPGYLVVWVDSALRAIEVDGVGISAIGDLEPSSFTGQHFFHSVANSPWGAILSTSDELKQTTVLTHVDLVGTGLPTPTAGQRQELAGARPEWGTQLAFAGAEGLLISRRFKPSSGSMQLVFRSLLVDAGVDGGADSGTDAGVDAAVDAGTDSGVSDASVDAAVDAGSDSGTDAGVDAAVDAGSDSGVSDASVDAAVDGGATVDGGEGFDAGADANSPNDGGSIRGPWNLVVGCGCAQSDVGWSVVAALTVWVSRRRR